MTNNITKKKASTAKKQQSFVHLTAMQLAVCAATAITLAANFAANILPLNGKTTGQISDQYPIFFVPAGYVFAIWGLIYILVILFTVYQASEKHKTTEVIVALRPWYILSALANTLWIFCWHYDFIYVSVICMLVLLISLCVMYIKAERIITTPTRELYLYITLPISIYLGWISVATIANISAALSASQWHAFGIAGDVWAAILVSIATLLGTYFVTEKKDVAFAAVILWAIIGIGVKFNSNTTMLLATFFGSTILLFLVARKVVKFGFDALYRRP